MLGAVRFRARRWVPHNAGSAWVHGFGLLISAHCTGLGGSGSFPTPGILWLQPSSS